MSMFSLLRDTRKLQSVSFELNVVNVRRTSVISLALLFTWCHIRASGTANGSSVLLPCMDTCVFTDLTPWWRHMDRVRRLKEEPGFRASTSSQACKCAGGSLTPAPWSLPQCTCWWCCWGPSARWCSSSWRWSPTAAGWPSVCWKRDFPNLW